MRGVGHAVYAILTWMYAFVQTVYLPVIGLVDPKDLSPGDLVGVNKDSYHILEKLPDE